MSGGVYVVLHCRVDNCPEVSAPERASFVDSYEWSAPSDAVIADVSGWHVSDPDVLCPAHWVAQLARQAAAQTEHERKTYERLKAKFEGGSR